MIYITPAHTREIIAAIDAVGTAKRGVTRGQFGLGQLSDCRYVARRVAALYDLDNTPRALQGAVTDTIHQGLVFIGRTVGGLQAQHAILAQHKESIRAGNTYRITFTPTTRTVVEETFNGL